MTLDLVTVSWLRYQNHRQQKKNWTTEKFRTFHYQESEKTTHGIGENICKSYYLVSDSYPQQRTIIQQNPSEKCAKNSDISPEDTQMTYKHMKRCSTSLVMREMQTKTTMNHFTPNGMTVIKKKCWCNGETWTCVLLAWMKRCSCCGKVLWFLEQVNVKNLKIQQPQHHSGYRSEEGKAGTPNSRPPQSGQEVGATQVSSGRTDQHNVVPPHDKVLFSHKKKILVHTTVYEPRGLCAKWSQKQKDKHYLNPFIWGPHCECT